MKKQILTTLLVIGVAALFSGCGIKTKSCELGTGYENYKDSKTLFLTGNEEWRSPSAGYNVKTRNTHVLQNAAQLTLDEGYKYFAFIKPSGAISNKEGSLINTAQGFLDKCAPIGLNPFTVGNSNCGWDSVTVYARAIIVVFNKEPLEMTTYNAQEVKEYMSSKGLWREDGIATKYKACTLDMMR